MKFGSFDEIFCLVLSLSPASVAGKCRKMTAMLRRRDRCLELIDYSNMV